ncbi:glycoside hydrolase family 105 protein [Paenibacillus sp. YN15]|uniref:glycoside hydrolase family 88/105 protein n=1 Tax=Paenibacillus sp. YN15 TaxID=1742774 RepID=UPI000DCBBE8A|nr:glycoside hydrolase family 88 protein [Paenibacillus sp. YN15]RAV04630.1 glycosyl hydrolase [Paenibacillus sp. YN15]
MTIIANPEILQQKALSVCGKMLEDHAGNWGMDIHHWDWVPGVGVISILEYYEQSGNQDLMEQLVKWARQNLHQSEQMKVINSMAPFAIFPALYRETGDAAFLDIAVRIGQWMLHEAPRTREGAFEHTVTENASFPEQVWADTIFMAVLFLARLGRQTGDSAYTAEALRQLELHLSLLQDEKTGVLFHGWNCIAQDHMSAARWTRANAWIAVGTPMILKEVGDILPDDADIIRRYKTMMQGLLAYQQDNGLWNTVMDQADFYPETSGSAGIAAGLLKARRMGLLGDEVLEPARRALQGVLANIGEDGTVHGVSGGTPVMPSVAAYNEIPCYPSLYGQGLTLILLSEALAE